MLLKLFNRNRAGTYILGAFNCNWLLKPGEEIRTPEIGMGASAVSVHGPVREALVATQREMAREGGVVLEGRDTGTVVFPDADAKFFLDAAAADGAAPEE